MDRATARKNTHKQQEKPSDVRCHGLGALCCLRFCWRYHFRGVTKMYASEQHAGDAAGMVWQLKCCARRVLHGQRVWGAPQQALARQGALYIQRHCLQHLWWYHGALLAGARHIMRILCGIYRAPLLRQRRGCTPAYRHRGKSRGFQTAACQTRQRSCRQGRS